MTISFLISKFSTTKLTSDYTNVIPALAKPVIAVAISKPGVVDETTSNILSCGATAIACALIPLEVAPIAIRPLNAGVNSNGVPTGVKVLLNAGALYNCI